ncbi:MAG: NAD-dependent epimerase/dehydratase family protein [Saprospiraceae bacterium]
MEKNSAILVTGGTGFVGSYLLRYLVEYGYSNIFALKRSSSPMDLVQPVADKIQWLEGDILDLPFLEEALEGKEFVFHCAAVVSFKKNEHQKMMRINEEGTANLVNLCLFYAVKKLVHVSSIAALGRAKDGAHINEQTSWENSDLNTNYAISKFQSEVQVWRGIAEGLNAAIVNPSLIFGGGFWEKGTAQMVTTIDKGLSFYTKGGSGIVDVRDVAKYMIRLMESDISSQRYLLNGANVTYLELFSAIAKQLDRKTPSIELKKWMQEIAWRVFWVWSKLTGKNPIFTKETAMITGKQFFYENEKSLKAFDFSYTPLEETIRDSTTAYQKAKSERSNSSYLPLN